MKLSESQDISKCTCGFIIILYPSYYMVDEDGKQIYLDEWNLRTYVIFSTRRLENFEKTNLEESYSTLSSTCRILCILYILTYYFNLIFPLVRRCPSPCAENSRIIESWIYWMKTAILYPFPCKKDDSPTIKHIIKVYRLL